MKKIIFSIVFVSIAIFAGGFLLHSQKTSASVNDNVVGWAWSNNTGWISMNCKTGGANSTDICATSNYGVNLNTDGTLTGYAWSDNVGWIKFGGLSGFPTATVNQATRDNAKVSSAKVSGFIRACPDRGPGRTNFCPDNSVASANEWDGWISLSGNNTHSSPNVNGTGGVTYKNGSTFVGWAWGSDIMGWIDFSGVSVLQPALTFKVYRTAAGSGTASTSTMIGSTGDSATLTWTGTNVSSCMSFSGPTNDSNWSNGASQTSSGNITVTPTSQNVYELHCLNSNGQDYKPAGAWPTVTVNVNNPSFYLSANPLSVPDNNRNTTLSRSGSGVSGCSASASPTVSGWSGSKTVTSSNQNQTVSVPSSPTNYTLSCNDSISGASLPSKNVSVTILPPPPPVVNLQASPTRLDANTGLTTLTWSTTNNATSCTASASDSKSDFTGSKAIQNSGGDTIKVNTTTTYTLMCSNASGGSGSDSVQVRIKDCIVDGCGGQLKPPKIIEI